MSRDLFSKRLLMLLAEQQRRESLKSGDVSVGSSFNSAGSVFGSKNYQKHLEELWAKNK